MFLIFQILCNNKVIKKIELSEKISLIPLKGKHFNSYGHSGYLSMPSFIFIQEFDEIVPHFISDNLIGLKSFLEFYCLFFDSFGEWPIRSFDLGYTKPEYAKTIGEMEEIKKNIQLSMQMHDTSRRQNKTMEVKSGLNNIRIDFSPFKKSTKNILCKCKIEEAWNKFLLLSRKEHNQISLHLFNPFHSSVRYDRVYNNEALLIGLQLSVLESLIGRAKSCDNKLDCTVCNRKNMQHDSQSINKFMESELDKYLYFYDNKKYIKLVVDLWGDVRNSLFHRADSFKSSTFKSFTERYRSIEISDIDVKKRKTHREDSLHYENSLLILKSIIRVMILSRLFSDEEKLNKNWPDISLFRTTTVSG